MEGDAADTAATTASENGKLTPENVGLGMPEQP